jgi:Fic family protein
MAKYVLKKLPLPNDFNTIEILKLTSKAEEALSELDKAILAIPNYELILQPLTIREAVASNEIESIRTTAIEMLQAELQEPQTLPYHQKEVIHYKKSLILGLNIVNQNSKLLLEDLINIHCGIVPDKIGIRTRPGVHIGNRLGEIIYTPPQEESIILDYLNNLFDYIYSNQSNNLVKVIIAHYQFEAIHPFYDGNGRTGRILMALQFCLEKKLRYPILYTSGYIVKNKQTYYELFRSIQDDDNWNDWIIFHLNGIVNQANETLLRVNEIVNLQSKTVPQLHKLIKIPKAKKIDIEQYFFSQAFYTATNMSRVLKISRNTAKKYLDILEKNKLFGKRKVAKEQLYFMQEFVDILS